MGFRELSVLGAINFLNSVQLEAAYLATFKFRLAAVLRLRERIQEEKELELRALNLEYGRRVGEIVKLEAQLDAVGADASDEPEKIISPIELQLQDQYAQRLSRLIEQRRRELVALEEPRRIKQQELADAARDVKSLDLLRQRAAEKFRAEENRAEQKFLDEIGQRRGRGME